MWSSDWYIAGQTLQPVDEIKWVGIKRCKRLCSTAIERFR